MQTQNPKMTGDESTRNIHVLAANDVEDLLTAIDGLYWRIYELMRKRAIQIAFDPHALSQSIQTK